MACVMMMRKKGRCFEVYFRTICLFFENSKIGKLFFDFLVLPYFCSKLIAV